ncbi:MAG TPA: AgmX/PglI C-terminal domain-containing protein [Myxococcaceae bacterium]|nr:AgmX/PglI C-terminal domain-containing protein [Myxococcaceae bacterium]
MTSLLSILVLTLAAADGGVPLTPPPDATPVAAADAGVVLPDVSKLPFTPDSITQVVRAHQPEIQECYEKMLAMRKEKLQGKLLTRFLITPAGTAKSAQVLKKGTTLKDKDLDACVVGVLQGMVFPKPPDKKDHPVEYPFNLQAVE